jgi:hypothetical protein
MVKGGTSNLQPAIFNPQRERLCHELRKQRLDVFARERLEHAAFGRDQLIDQGALVLLQLQNLFFHGVAQHQFIHKHRLVLPDTVAAVAGLLLRRRVPLRVDVDDIIGGGQVQPDAASF